MDNDLRKYIKAATAPVSIDEAVAHMGSKRRLAKVLGCANQTFTRFSTRNKGAGMLSPLLSMRWRAAREWATKQRGKDWAALLNEIVDAP